MKKVLYSLILIFAVGCEQYDDPGDLISEGVTVDDAGAVVDDTIDYDDQGRIEPTATDADDGDYVTYDEGLSLTQQATPLALDQACGCDYFSDSIKVDGPSIQFGDSSFRIYKSVYQNSEDLITYKGGKLRLGGSGGSMPKESLEIGQGWGVNYSGRRAIISDSTGLPGYMFGESSSKRGWLLWDNNNGDIIRMGGTGTSTIWLEENVGIKTKTPDYELDVNGTIRSKEIIVETGWSDFVFDKDYKLMPLDKVEKFINAHGHLPDMRNEADVVKNGARLGETATRLLQKVEELTLHAIEMNKKILQQERQISKLQNSLKK